MTHQEPRSERPPEGLARGRYEAPPWLIAALAGAVVLVALLSLLARAWRR